MAAIVAAFTAGTSAVGYAQGAGWRNRWRIRRNRWDFDRQWPERRRLDRRRIGYRRRFYGWLLDGRRLNRYRQQPRIRLLLDRLYVGHQRSGERNWHRHDLRFRWRHNPVANYGAGRYRLGYSAADTVSPIAGTTIVGLNSANFRAAMSLPIAAA